MRRLAKGAFAYNKTFTNIDNKFELNSIKKYRQKDKNMLFVL